MARFLSLIGTRPLPRHDRAPPSVRLKPSSGMVHEASVGTDEGARRPPSAAAQRLPRSRPPAAAGWPATHRRLRRHGLPRYRGVAWGEAAMQAEPERRVSTIRLEGTFDLPAARLLEHSLRTVRAGDRVMVDFSRVRQFNDFGVAVLARALNLPAGVELRLSGLGIHQVRLLRYFGVGPALPRPCPLGRGALIVAPRQTTVRHRLHARRGVSAAIRDSTRSR